MKELRGQRTLFNLDRQILQNNLYGVDLNAEAIQICRLNLWIKTAARGKQLTSLDHTIREGNGVISDPAVRRKAFDWQAAFPEVFPQGGFDVVVGNPPYIRQELLTPLKPWLEANYKVFHGMADRRSVEQIGTRKKQISISECTAGYHRFRVLTAAAGFPRSLGLKENGLPPCQTRVTRGCDGLLRICHSEMLKPQTRP